MGRSRISLYQPTHRHHPANQQDPIRFRGLVKNMELMLLENHSQAQARSLLDDLGERVLKNGGQVFVVPGEQMPTATGAAATCRY